MPNTNLNISDLAKTARDKSPHKAKNLGLSAENEALLDALAHRKHRDLFRIFDLPYGYWLTQSGRTILFNRRYQPIYEIDGDGKPHPANRNEWVPGIIDRGWFYYDGTPEHCKAASGLVALQTCGISVELPEKLRWRDYSRRTATLPVPPRCAA